MINNNFFFKIQDYGIGIPQKDQEFLFNAFHRAQNSKAIPGTGLGLNIISTLIQNSGGTIEFTSVENEGSTFIINLPLN
jgi:signal transduction histidine kinase